MAKIAFSPSIVGEFSMPVAKSGFGTVVSKKRIRAVHGNTWEVSVSQNS